MIEILDDVGVILAVVAAGVLLLLIVGALFSGPHKPPIESEDEAAVYFELARKITGVELTDAGIDYEKVNVLRATRRALYIAGRATQEGRNNRRLWGVLNRRRGERRRGDRRAT